METYGAYEAKTHLPKLLERVAKGERVVITKHGVPIAMLAPYNAKDDEPESRRETITKLRAFRKRHSLKGLSLRSMIEEGRR